MVPANFKRYAVIILSCAFLFNVLYFSNEYFVHSPIHKNWYRNEGFDTMVYAVNKVYNDYDHIIVTKTNGEIYSEILFFTNFDPATYLQEGHTKDAAYTGFGKFFFVNSACPATNGDNKIPKGKNLYVESGLCNNVPGQSNQVYIRRLDGTPVFHLVYE